MESKSDTNVRGKYRPWSCIPNSWSTWQFVHEPEMHVEIAWGLWSWGDYLWQRSTLAWNTFQGAQADYNSHLSPEPVNSGLDFSGWSDWLRRRAGPGGKCKREMSPYWGKKVLEVLNGPWNKKTVPQRIRLLELKGNLGIIWFTLATKFCLRPLAQDWWGQGWAPSLNREGTRQVPEARDSSWIVNKDGTWLRK